MIWDFTLIYKYACGAGDIVRTVAVAPTMQNVLVLAVVVLVRTFLSWSLNVEIKGKWPWQETAQPE